MPRGPFFSRFAAHKTAVVAPPPPEGEAAQPPPSAPLAPPPADELGGAPLADPDARRDDADEPPPEDLEALSRDQLLDLARELGVKADGRTGKAALIQRIETARQTRASD